MKAYYGFESIQINTQTVAEISTQRSLFIREAGDNSVWRRARFCLGGDFGIQFIDYEASSSVLATLGFERCRKCKKLGNTPRIDSPPLSRSEEVTAEYTL